MDTATMGQVHQIATIYHCTLHLHMGQEYAIEFVGLKDTPPVVYESIMSGSGVHD